jgi:hypothetical protein
LNHLRRTRDPDLHHASVDVGPDPNDERRRNADEGSSEESSNGGRRDSDLNDSGSISHGLKTEKEDQPKRDGHHGSDGGDGGGGEEPNMVDDKWDSPLHRTRVKLHLKISETHTYSVAIGHTFKVGCILNHIVVSTFFLVYDKWENGNTD